MQTDKREQHLLGLHRNPQPSVFEGVEGVDEERCDQGKAEQHRGKRAPRPQPWREQRAAKGAASEEEEAGGHALQRSDAKAHVGIDRITRHVEQRIKAVERAGVEIEDHDDPQRQRDADQPESGPSLACRAIDEGQGDQGQAKVLGQDTQSHQATRDDEVAPAVVVDPADEEHQRPTPESQHRHIRHERRRGDEKHRGGEGDHRSQEGLVAEALGQAIDAQGQTQGGEQHAEMQRELRPTRDPGHQCEVVAHQWRILVDLVHGLAEAVPVDVEAKEICRRCADLLGGPEKHRIVDMKRLPDKGEQQAECHETQPELLLGA